MAHQSCFALRTRGGVTCGDEWIHDGDEPVARLEHVVVEQPEQNLRYFNRNPRPVNLRDLKLAPGGRPLIAGVQLFWNLGPVITTELVDIEVEGQDSDCLVMTVVTRDSGGVAESRRTLALTYDHDLGSYVYEFVAHLHLASPELFDESDEVRFEYSDPWYCDTPGPTVAFAGMWRQRYSRLLAETADQGVWQMPLNHMATGIPSPRSFAPDGRLVLAADPGNNPAFQFPAGTAERTAVSVCNWGYDVHISARYARDELYAPIAPCFRILQCDDDAVDSLLQRATPVPQVEYAGFRELPVYERQSSFENGLILNQPSRGDTDPWPWLPRGDGAEWCDNRGRSDRFSLKIAKSSPGPTAWTMDREGEGGWTERWRRDIGFRVEVYASTEEVEGRGASLAVRWIVYNRPEPFPYICSQRLVGNHDWTRLQVEIQGPPPPEVSAIAIILRQEGSGTTWFDDLEVVPH